MLPDAVSHAVKEWAVVIEAIRTGKQVFLLRKGGLIEPDAPEFERPSGPFVLAPTFKKQKADLIHLQALAVAVRLHELLQLGLPLDLEVDDVTVLHNRKGKLCWPCTRARLCRCLDSCALCPQGTSVWLEAQLSRSLN